MTEIRVPLYRPSLKGNEARYVLECLDSSWLTFRGRFVGEFEKQFSERTGAQHALAVCNGTAALHLAVLALGIGPGDEVIVPTLTYIAAANAVAYAGATPVFADSERETWQLDSESVQERITSKTKAILAVHLYGQPCDMDAIGELAERHGLFVIEDCAEAFGAEFNARHVGTIGDIGAFSFFGNKTITTGEGGMVVSQKAELIERCMRLRGHGVVPGREYWHDLLGYNYRITNVSAAIGLAQLERADELLRRKRELADAYYERLSHLPLDFHREAPGTVHSYWMVSALSRNAQERDALRKHLAAAGIETRPLFHPIHTMPIYPNQFERRTIAEDLADCGLNLPSWPDLGADELAFICDTVDRFFSHA